MKKQDYLKLLLSIPLNFNFSKELCDNEVIVSIGKSAFLMYKEFCLKYKDAGNKKALIIVPEGLTETTLPENCKVVYSTHPFISEKSFAAAQTLKNFIVETSPSVVNVLLSGGSSALIEDSLNPFKTMDINRSLLYSGFNIVELNKERIKNSLIKGGKFAEFYPEVHFRVFVMSDIPFENGELYVGSNPFFRKDLKNTTIIKVADSDTLHDHILENYQPLENRKTISIRRFNGSLENLHSIIKEHIKNSCDNLLVTGEPTVKVDKFKSGKGGRMSHLALGLIPFIDNSVSIDALSSDGIDGNSVFAGSVVNGIPLRYIVEKGEKELGDFNSAFYLETLGCMLETGYTGINLNDFVIVQKTN